VRSLQQAPSRQAARCSAAEALAAGSPGPAGSPQAARRHVRAAVSDPDCSLPAPRRPTGSGSAGAMSRVGGALREQPGGGCVRLGERCASRAACLSCGLCAQLTWASRYRGTMVSKLWAAGRGQCGEDGHSSPHWVLPKRQFGRPVVTRGLRSLDPVYAQILYDIDCLCRYTRIFRSSPCSRDAATRQRGRWRHPRIPGQLASETVCPEHSSLPYCNARLSFKKTIDNQLQTNKYFRILYAVRTGHHSCLA
jgi:hypothetical protein